MIEDPDITPEKLINEQPLYKIKTIPFDEIGVLATEKYDKNLNLIPTNEELPVGELTHSFHANGHIYYDSRLWLKGITTNFNKWLTPIGNSGGDELITVNVMFEYKIITQQGVFYKKSDVYTQITDSAFPILYLPYLITYPDSRASELRILVKISGVWKTVFTCELKPSERENYSYVFLGDGADIDKSNNPYSFKVPITTDTSLGIRRRESDILRMSTNIQGYWLIPSSGTYSTSTTTEQSPLDPNRVQVCDVNNPFYFLAKNSYQVGFGEIQDLAVNTVPMTNLQFGQHPVIVLSTDGIFALEIGNGSVLVTRVIPMSTTPVVGRSINAGEVIVFKNNSGLYSLVGRDVKHISEKLEGVLSNPLSGKELFDYMTESQSINDTSVALNEVDFLTYLEDALLLYDNTFKELIVSNKDYNYSYVLHEGMWYKRHETFVNIIQSNPYNYCIISKNGGETTPLCLLDQEDSNFAYCFIESRDLKFSESFTRIERMLFQGLFKLVNSSGVLSSIIVGIWGKGEPEASNRILLNAKRFHTNEVNNTLTVGRMLRSEKYYRLVFKGIVNNLILGDIFIDVEQKWPKL